MPDFLISGPADAAVTLILAHGAGAPMDSDWMDMIAAALGAEGVRTARFEFAYMAARRRGERKPPPKGETLVGEYLAAIDALPASGTVLIGGKSLGGRVASMVAGDLQGSGRIAGLVCLGYPFHPPGQPAKLRTAHLENLACPALVCQGERDPFGTRDEASAYKLSKTIDILWLADGDHDLKPRKASGHTLAGHLATVAAAVSGFARKPHR